MTARIRLMLVVGARPNFMKIAPIVHELQRRASEFDWRLVHTGQHYDASMSDVFFAELGIPRPHVDLGVGSGSHARQTAAIMSAFEPVLLDWPTDWLVVVGDVNSTVACALVASKLGTRIAHVEAGLRSFDRAMPEEINRVLTDQLSDLLFVTEPAAVENLTREGIAADKVHFVGNVMIDTLLRQHERARALKVAEQHGLVPQQYAVLTLHRPSNVDDADAFERLLEGLEGVARDVPVMFPVHPRTRPALAASARADAMVRRGALRLLDPMGYLPFLGLMADSRLVLTDSGGIQEETTVLGVPCLTLRDTTERPVTISEGTNRLVGTDPQRVLAGWNEVKHDRRPRTVPKFWDGAAAQRIVDVLSQQRRIPAETPQSTAALAHAAGSVR